MDGMNPFAPLSPAEVAHANATPAAPVPAEDWAPQRPAPKEPPEAGAIRHRRHGAASSRWVYRDAEGRPLFAMVRFDPKNPDGSPKLGRDGKPMKEVLPLTFGMDRVRLDWYFKAAPKPRPLYGLDRLAARPDAPVLVVEGEKAAEAAAVALSCGRDLAGRQRGRGQGRLDRAGGPCGGGVAR
jgi:hypothetical protein